MLSELERSSKIERFHTATFDVEVGTTSAERRLYHSSQGTDILALFFVFALAAVIAIATLSCMCYYNSHSPRNEYSQSSPSLMSMFSSASASASSSAPPTANLVKE
jgi:hypothetical protein